MDVEQTVGLFWGGATRQPPIGLAAGEHCMWQAQLRILRCTALALRREPGGLRFVPGSRPWLPGADDEASHRAAWVKS